MDILVEEDFLSYKEMYKHMKRIQKKNIKKMKSITGLKNIKKSGDRSYPTGGGGPTAYGPTSYFGSDPRPAEDGDNLNNPIDLGDFSSIFKSFVIKNTHGGLTRKQTTFYNLNSNYRPPSAKISSD